jgi:flagellin
MSVNTNPGALIALQNLNATNRSLETTKNRVNTGLKVNGYKDNAAVFAIAQNLRAEQSGLNAVKSSLDNATSILDVSLAAGEAVSDILGLMKEKAVAAADPSIDDTSRTALNNEFQELIKQVDTIVNNASFNGVNILNGDTDAVKALVSGKLAEVTTGTGSTATTATTIQTIEVSGTNLTSSALAGKAIDGTTDLTLASMTIGTATAAKDVMSAIEDITASVNAAMAKIGSGAQAVEAQNTFVTKLADAIESGIGNLVDADMAKESARLQSLQVKQQLGIQALSIANQAPSVVLSLFR